MIVKVAKVKSTRFCVVSAYLSGQNIKAEVKINNVRELVSFKVYSHVDRAAALKLDLADSVFVQSSLKEISNHLNLLCKKMYKPGPLLTEAGLSFIGVLVWVDPITSLGEPRFHLL